MSTAILTTAGAAACAHQGTVSLTSSQSVLRVDGAFAVLADDAGTASLVTPSTCTIVPDTSKGLVQCTKVTALESGAGRLLRVDGKAVALASGSGATNGSTGSPGTGRWSVSAPGQLLLVEAS